LETVKALKPRKSPGSDGINNELYKHVPKSFLHTFLNFLNVCWIYRDIPEEWRTAIVIPMYKKGDRNNPHNYSGISLLNTLKNCRRLTIRTAEWVQER
jgi:hypothetical protein